VLCPTRELAKQTYREFKKFGGMRKFSYHFLTKVSANSDILTKDCGSKDVLIATPMYLLKMLKEDRIDLSRLQFCILDEADCLFDSQFKDAITHILEYIDLVKVTVALFSATLANGIDEWCFSNLDNFVQVYIGAVNGANLNIKQSLKFVGTEESKIYTLRIIIQEGFRPPMLVFTQTKDRAKQVYAELKLVNEKINVIHSDLPQQKREEVIHDFRSGKTWILICTDLMGRGIDFKNINCVVNFDLPQTKVDYIHRIGRTGRAGREGNAITFFTEQDKERLPSIISVLKNSGCDVPDWLSNMKGIARRDYKKATKKPVKRKDIITMPKYDIERATKRKAIIADSKAKKKAKSEMDQK
jgi:ATP-dependent RNA helicase DDX52/ROK1